MTKSSQAANLPLDNGRFKSFCYRTVPQLVLNATNYELHVNVSLVATKFNTIRFYVASIKI